MAELTIDGVTYDLESLPTSAREILNNITFTNELILQKNNEIQVTHTAQIGYLAALKREVKMIEK